METAVITKKCSKCGLVKPFSRVAWHVSRGVPSGHICKKCKAEGLRAWRRAQKNSEKVIDLFQSLPRKKLVALVNAIALVDRIDRKIYLRQDTQEAQAAECLEIMSFDQAVEHYVRTILAE